MSVRNIRIDSFDYPLPAERIALHPLERRDACKLLVAGPSGRITHGVFSDLPLFTRPDTLIVANETKVIRARMEFMKPTGARIEIFLLEPRFPHDYAENFASGGPCVWNCLIGNRKRWKEGVLEKILEVPGVEAPVRMVAEHGDREGEVRFSWNNPVVSFAEIVEAAGNIPIPPYLNRESEDSDTVDYQTVYSRTEGSVAAPTAGLHFTPGLIEELRHHGNEFATVTLHVGAGTFQPVKSDEIGGHPMHSEWISVSRHTLCRVIRALEEGRDILAVGTTSVRTLESLPYLGRMVERGGGNDAELRVTQWMPYDGESGDFDTLRSLRALLDYMKARALDVIEADTSIMIAPGFRWRIVSRLITNFHQPKSTLLLLVSSFLGDTSTWRKIYDEALEKGYRFLSYGDACLFSRGPQPVKLPSSKSMVLRAAVILAVRSVMSPSGPEELKDKLDSLTDCGLCDDSEFFIKALLQTVESVMLPSDETAEINIGEGAAPLRFLTAFAASLPGARVSIHCSSGLGKRPLMPLIDALRRLGAFIVLRDELDASVREDWFLRVRGRRLHGGTVTVDSSLSSQFVSALMLASPLWEQPMSLRNSSDFPQPSSPYIRMTGRMMDSFPDVKVEPDWSAAAFFYEFSLIKGCRVDIVSLVPPAASLQGDSSVCDIFSSLGVNTVFNADGSAVLMFDGQALALAKERGVFEFDFSGCPDLVPPVAVALCYRHIPFRFTGIGHLRHKESDRLSALSSNLVRLGYGVSAGTDSLVFNGDFLPMTEFPVEIDSFDDHRIAMAFYPLELTGMAAVADKGVVSKSFPDFYAQFRGLV